MHAIVIVAGGRAMTEPAQAAAEALGARVVSFPRRPDLHMYDLVVLMLGATAQLDPLVLLWLAGGAVRGKALALAAEAPTRCMLRPLETLAERLGGARVEPGTLALAPWQREPAEVARAWAHRLSERHPAPSYPRGEPGRRANWS